MKTKNLGIENRDIIIFGAKSTTVFKMPHLPIAAQTSLVPEYDTGL